MARKLSTAGFSTTLIMAAVVVLAVVGLAGWQVYRTSKQSSKMADSGSTPAQQQMSKPSSNPPSSGKTVVATEDDKVSMSLPNSWHIVPDANNPGGNQIISVNKNKQRCQGGVCGVAGCLHVQDASPCIYEAEFQPKALNAAKDPRWSLTVEESDWSIAQAAQSLPGDLNAQNEIERSSEEINGYDAFYVKTKSSGSSVGDYVDIHYFVKKGRYLVHLSNREQHKNTSASSWDNSKYSPEFADSVKSLKLNF